MTSLPSESPDTDSSINPAAARRVGLGAFALLAAALGAYLLLRGPSSPPPLDVASNPVLLQGREVYLARCVSCHGERGRGDGPIAKGLAGPPVGDLTDDRWKHGDRPEDVLRIVRQGVPNTSMAAWGRILSEDDTRAVAAYALYLGGREFPETLAAP